MNKLLIICGPTATGKTALAASLAKELDGELVSADSRQVYRGMDITTGKDRPDAPIWLYDVVDPDEDFSVSHWVTLARDAIENIQSRNKLPIIVGGTGLYINALLYPMTTIDIPPDERLREKLKTLSVAELQQLTTRGIMNDSDWQNPRRLIRKIEISESHVKHTESRAYDAYIIGLTASMEELHKRIDMRMKKRLSQGMEAEASRLQKLYDKNLPSMSAIGVNEYAYAKRQMTWFKKQKNIQWFDISKPEVLADILAVVKKWYTSQ